MNFTTAISTCLSKYATFKGRATRSEFWWFYLFTVLLSWGASLVGATLGEGGEYLSTVVSLVFFIPAIAAGSRRLHDIGRSGWWQLVMLTGIGAILLVVWWALDSKKEANQHGNYVPVGASS